MKSTVTIKNNYEFHRLYTRGKSAGSPLLVIYCRKNRRAGCRIGVTVSKKLGHAVMRNKIRRRIREIYRTTQDRLLPGFDLVVVARRGSVSASYWDLNADFLRLSGRLGLIQGEQKK